ncbi:3-hydroxyisobutyrate dehydrogenase [Alicycliphilus denitrificans]|uniref:3-hydroxyisobutyrate dehydrogenase n=1 Tax=Alicycliphilus denitrificans TaxID=179636 RepID=UPI00095EE054|nr:3-hydroxyisobutyrate dehydrogenase [Alicycliphilus denitrificans]MBN9572844.1 3-hydroxyisobutyrate dehydrogenase [Alicycliphilus denitrificans]OJW91069.1 MAG: 3-hydroxyisobutyrate dehydrogenase [Alicycliphilus sp. 69-12]BCN39297.1 3-hydroxyisobutyrate dehydrogenase [Alicycliphilus denitrificans]
MQIAFIGLGNMGGPMAINLIKAGHSVKAFDLSQDALAKVKAEGGQAAASAQDAVQGAEAVISMLPASQHVEGLYLGSGNLLASIAKGTLVIDSSTIAAATSQKVAKAAEGLGLDFIDAPVSGGTGGAIAGTLTFMVGGSDAALERARPLLEKMGKNIFHAGTVGAGQTAKICNNMLLGILMIGTSEAISLGVANGLDPKVLSEIMRRSSGGNWALEVYNPYPGVQEASAATRGYTGGFGTDLMLKDLGLSQENAAAVKASTPLGALARALYAAHSLAGHGGEDFSSVIKMLQKNG